MSCDILSSCHWVIPKNIRCECIMCKVKMQRNILWPDKNMFLKFRPHRLKHSWNKLRTILEEVCYYRSPPPSKCSGHDPTSSPRLPMDEFTYAPRISSGPSNTKVIYHGAVHHWQLILNKKEFKTAKLLKGWMVRGGHERRSDIIRGRGSSGSGHFLVREAPLPSPPSL